MKLFGGNEQRQVPALFRVQSAFLLALSIALAWAVALPALADDEASAVEAELTSSPVAETAQQATQQKYSKKYPNLKGRYANLVQLETEGPAVYLQHREIDMLGYDSVRLGDVTLKFDEEVKPISDKGRDRVATRLGKGEDDWLSISGLRGGVETEACGVVLNIHVRKIKVDDQKLAESKNYRSRLYGSAVLELNFTHKASGELLSVVARGVPLMVKQRDRGNRERKIIASLPRSVSEAIGQAFDYIAPSITERVGEAEPRPGCSAGIAKSWLAKNASES